ncbi:pilus assembly protein [Pararhizobium sp. YC-54]|uniref:pilus assembly protein TadG-related protein n=1 Tax=Pararhizobium sp. YC-54 TaxID=2986920 RepID=UPI0021F6DEE4|nr:TadE/TadG family type IV pilus assembly protein [Pararhizobium sp. YC-54]MCV9997789.1 pilus assembly protein [Pararhizobium sp. YC-54]
MRRPLKAYISNFLGDEKGNFATLTAIAFVPVIGAAAMVLDLGSAYLEAAKIQGALDSAALSAVRSYGEGSSEEETAKEASQLFFGNFAVPANSEPLAEGENLSGFSVTLVHGALEDTATAQYAFNYKPLFLERLPFEISKHAVAARVPGIEACILALHPTKFRSFEVSGSADIDMSGCTITANSTDAQAIYVGGSGQLKAECLFAAGGISIDSTAVQLACEAPLENGPQVADPFKYKKLPVAGTWTSLAGCGQNFVAGGGGNGNCNGTGKTPNGNNAGYVVTLKPGTYESLELKGAIKLEPGSYIIDGGSLQLTSQSVVTGQGVTFFLLNHANLVIHGGATFHISPSLAGDWAGFSIVTEHGNTEPAVINGNSSSSLTGIIYMPDTQEIQYSGNGATSGECIRLVAQEITLTGNSYFKMNCDPELANTKINNPGAIRLVQ